ncbi:MAG TPA: hypothetical protein PLC89_18525, partial [Haliscomenobacter sp.]|uniref:hypothetical protein n=1 Tax=Haliscomenobacter sp. TaxID=2717303 RepID=UPI002C4C222D
VYFFVHSAAMHSKISLNQGKNPLFFISSALVAISLEPQRTGISSTHDTIWDESQEKRDEANV